jgi:hypothetical protein
VIERWLGSESERLQEGLLLNGLSEHELLSRGLPDEMEVALLQRRSIALPRVGHVSRPFPSWNRSILTEIYLCHACSCQETS